MDIRKVASILFYDNKGNILFQNRKKISKHGEGYGFFGGQIEEGESPEQALAREIKEELSLNLTELKELKFFKIFKIRIKKWDLEVHHFVFIAKIPELNKIEVHEGEAEIIKFKDSFNLKLVPGDKQILKKIYGFLNKK